MVKHIVLFKLRNDIPEETRRAAALRFKEAIEAHPDETWTIALYGEFDTLADVRAYATHPDHVAAGKLLAEVRESRACVDYEI